jgi:hypothetical protein
MLGFYPIADAPLASGQWSDNVTLASQTLNFSQNSVLISDDDVIEVAGQVLTLTLNGVSLSTTVDATLASQTLTFTENSVLAEVQPPTFDSQTITLTLNGVSLVTNVNAVLASQNLALTLRSVSLSTNNYIDLTSQTLASTLNSVSLSVDQVLPLASQLLTLTEHPVSLITDQTIVAASQTIYTELNSLRMWGIIPTDQPGNCPDHCDGTWATIAFDEEVFGDDFAIATEPLCALPQALPPIRKFPGSAWNNVPAQTTTTWTNIPT